MKSHRVRFGSRRLLLLPSDDNWWNLIYQLLRLPLSFTLKKKPDLTPVRANRQAYKRLRRERWKRRADQVLGIRRSCGRQFRRVTVVIFRVGNHGIISICYQPSIGLSIVLHNFHFQDLLISTMDFLILDFRMTWTWLHWLYFQPHSTCSKSNLLTQQSIKETKLINRRISCIQVGCFHGFLPLVVELCEGNEC